MRKSFLLIIPILLLFANAWSFISPSSSEMTEGEVSAVADFCSSCAGEADADLFCEDFGGSETITNDGTCAECTGWTATEAGSGAVTCEAVSGTLSCTDKSGFAINSSANDEAAFIVRTWADADNFYTVFYFNFKTDNIVTGGSNKNLQFFELEGDGTDLAKLQITKIDGDQSLDIRLGYLTGASMTFTASYDANLTVNTWYQIELEHDRTADTVTTWLNDVQMHSETVDDMDTDEAEYGLSADGSATGTNVFQITNIKSDDDTMPNPCAGWSP